MKNFQAFLSAFFSIILNCSNTITVSNTAFNLLEQDSISSTSLEIKSITLLAREERRLPSGATPDPNRNIGFASVFIQIDNTKEKSVILIIKRIEIHQVSDNKIIMADRGTQEIYLHPLENSKNVFHLTNKTGYSGRDKVKAVLTYQIGEYVATIESDPVEVDRV